MSKTKIEDQQKGAAKISESLFTSTAVKFATLFFPSMSTQKQRDELRVLREKHVESHKRTLELQQEMHEFLTRNKLSRLAD